MRTCRDPIRLSSTLPTLLLNDYVALTLYGLIALLFAWLGFSRKGRSLLTSVSHQNESSRRDRLPKVFLASIGLAGGIWLILIVLSLVVGGPDLVVQMFETWVIMVLIAIAFPIAYKWLK